MFVLSFQGKMPAEEKPVKSSSNKGSDKGKPDSKENTSRDKRLSIRINTTFGFEEVFSRGANVHFMGD